MADRTTAPAIVAELGTGFPGRSARGSRLPIDAVARTDRPASDYLADEGIAGVVYLADRLGKPVLVEGPAGTGKTQLAKSVAELTGSRLIRLQCYEGLDESKALYEWNYKKQLLRIQAEPRRRGQLASELEEDIFSEEFLLTRPLLEAIRLDDPVVLLIDEVDRVELETEALLLEILSEYQVSIPELGTVRATPDPAGVPDLQQHPRALRGPQAPLPVPAHRLPGPRAGARHRRDPGAGHQPRRWPTRWPGSCARIRTLELKKDPVGVRDPRLGPHPGGAGRRVDRRRAGPDTLHILLKYQSDIERAAKELAGPWIARA